MAIRARVLFELFYNIYFCSVGRTKLPCDKPHPPPLPHPSNLRSHLVSLEIHPLTYLLLI